MKEVVLDIHAMTDAGDNLDVEMQTYGFYDYPPRALYNGAKLSGNPEARPSDCYYYQKKMRCHNRQHIG